MSRARPFLKVAAVVSSVLLVGAFIGCRTGAFRPLAKPEPQPAPTQPAPENPPTFMSGSKSLNGGPGYTIGLTPAGGAAPNDPAKPATTEPTPEKKPLVLMGGPKSAPVFGPVNGPAPANEPHAPPPATPNTPAP